jgi:hypothetical protein
VHDFYFSVNGLILLPPLLNMLGVRYVIFRGSASANAKPFCVGTDYWVGENTAALPRVFIPRYAISVPEDDTALERVSMPQFNPRETAYVEFAGDLPRECQGTAEIVAESPTRIKMTARMETPGLVVLGDRWDTGWRAYLDGKETKLLRANYALRGVLVPGGQHQIEFVYQPASFRLGLCLSGLGGAALVGWIINQRSNISSLLRQQFNART